MLLYQKSSERVFNVLRRELDRAYVEKVYTQVDENGRRYRLGDISAPGGRGPVYEWHGVTRPWRFTKDNMEALYAMGRIKTYPDGRAMINAYVRYLDESEGQPAQDWWDDVGVIAAPAKERLGYPTQKPLALLDRIVSASSNPGDIVLDPFCGCGTAVHAAQKLGRRWIGIDITYLAINLIERRMTDAFPGLAVEVDGAPKDFASARDLAHRDKWQFQWWALTRLDAQPVAGKKEGSDKGIDGVIPFFAGPKEDYKRAIVSVKGGEHVGVAMVRDLKGVLEREKEPIAVLLTLAPPTKDMVVEAAAAGFYESEFWERKFPRLQIMTIEEMLGGKKPDMPWGKAPFAKAPTEKERGEQEALL